MKKNLQFTLLFGLIILALTACNPLADIFGSPGVARASVAQEAQSQAAPVIAEIVSAVSTPTTSPDVKLTDLQLVVYTAEHRIHLLDVSMLLNPADKPAFNGMLSSGGSGTGVVMVIDTSDKPRVVAIDGNGSHELIFIQNPAIYGLAVWPGDAQSLPRLAWGTQPIDSAQFSSLQIGDLDGSKRDTLITIDAELPLQLTPEFWSADGQWLYFSQEPVGMGGYILFGGASNLYKVNITTTEVKALIQLNLLDGPQACLDAVSADYRYVADHCSQGTITVRDLLTDGTTTIQPPSEVALLSKASGSARFSPDGRRLAYALARSDPNNEQGWVAVSESLSGGSKLILSSSMGTYLTVAGWLDNQTILVQSTNLQACSPYCSSELWTVKADGSSVQKVADGSLITVYSGEPRLPDVLYPTPLPTSPPSPTPTAKPAPTAVPIPCNQARFVKDVTVKDGSQFDPGDDFVKTWRLENAGTCTWSKDYDLVFRSGDRMDGDKAISLGGKVKPGEMVDISVELTAPTKAGEYTGYWALRDDEGRIFGIGTGAKESFWVSIKVKAQTKVVYDFTANYCEATWSTSKFPSIPCPGLFRQDLPILPALVTLDTSPLMETGHEDDEPALITIPEDSPDGYIRGQFPAFKVEDGDRFKTVVGCLYESWDCSVSMILSYSIDGGSPVQIGKWSESYDNDITRIDIDLSFLAGKKVTFFLTTRAKDTNVDDWAFWLMPRIVR